MTTRRRPGRRPILPTCDGCRHALGHDRVHLTFAVDGSAAVRVCRACLTHWLALIDDLDADMLADLEALW